MVTLLNVWIAGNASWLKAWPADIPIRSYPVGIATLKGRAQSSPAQSSSNAREGFLTQVISLLYSHTMFAMFHQSDGGGPMNVDRLLPAVSAIPPLHACCFG
jgi:hypothetical protein